MKKSLFTFFIVTASGILVPLFVFAQSSGFYRLAGLPENDNGLLVIRILQIIWIILTVCSLGVAILGFLRMRNSGDDLVATQEAKKIFLFGAIGFGVSLIITIILFFAYGALVAKYEQQTTPPPHTGQEFDQTGNSFGKPLNQFLKITSHYPARDERSISRNVKILITFADPVKPESVLEQDSSLKKNVIRILLQGDQFKNSIPAKGIFNNDHTILTLTPDKLLGDVNKKIFYSVAITDLLQKETQESLLGSGNSYMWQFEISGSIDNTPPHVESVVPFANQEQEIWAKNSLIQITFNEALDPSVVSGKKMTVTNEITKKSLEGTWSIGNGYRSLSFVSQEPCGKNACQDIMYCLPKDSKISTTLKAANLIMPARAERPFLAQSPFDGITDAAGNSFDGNMNGKSEGSANDSYTWSFKTNDLMNSEPVSIEFIQPGRDKTGVDIQAPLEVLFTRLMDVTSLHNGTIVLSQEVSTWLMARNHEKAKKTSVKVFHDPLKKDTLYTPLVRSEARNMYQQCFFPCQGPPK